MNNMATFLRESRTAFFFIPVGIILIAFSIGLFVIGNNVKDYIEIEATVSKVELVEEAHTDENGDHVDATYNVYVQYTVDGKEYDELLGEMMGIKKGDKIKISYDPEDPSKISQQPGTILPIALLVGGIASLIFGIYSAVNSINKSKRMKEQEKGWTHE